MRRVLSHLGFFVAGQDERVKIAVPTWRPDVQGKADVVEEVVRILGVDRVPSTPFDRGEAPRKPVLTTIQVRTRKAKRALAARNLVETVTWSFIAKKPAELFGGGNGTPLANPIAAELSDMRPSLIPGLVAAAQRNADRAFPTPLCSKSVKCFAATRRKISSRRRPVCGARWRSLPASAVTGQSKTVRSTRSMPRPTRSPCLQRRVRPHRRRSSRTRAVRPGSIPAARDNLRSARQNVLGHFGELHPRALETLDAEGPLVGVRDRASSASPNRRRRATRAKPALELSAFQPVERDFAFVVERAVKAADIVRATQSVDRKLDQQRHGVRRVRGRGHRARQEVDRNRGDAAAAQDKTLTDAEIDALASKIVAEVGKRTGGVLRA